MLNMTKVNRDISQINISIIKLCISGLSFYVMSICGCVIKLLSTAGAIP